jgi:predicted PurR-regulated permease PerM
MQKRITYFLVPILIFLLLAWLTYTFATVIVYFIISFVLAALLKPTANAISSIYFMKRRLPRSLGVSVAFVLFLLLITGFVTLFIPLISEQVSTLSNLNINKLLVNLEQPITDAENFVIKNLKIKQQAGFIHEAFNKNLTAFTENIDIGNLIGLLLNSIIALSTGLSIGLLAVLFITFFLVYQQGFFRRRLLSLVPNAYFELAFTTIHKIEKLLANYLLGLAVQISSIFLFTSLGLSLLGVKYAVTIALLAALINVVPYIGPLVGGTLAVVLSISVANLPTSEAYLWLGIKVIIVEIIVHVIDNLISQPLIFSKSVKAHPLEIFTVIFIGAELAGAVGMIAAIPVYTIIRVSITELSQGYKQYRVFNG